MTASWPAWAVMWSLAVGIYAACKWLTWLRTPVTGVPAWRHAAYLLAWPGLDAAAFLTRGAEQRPSPGEWTAAAAKTAIGVALFFGVARLASPVSGYVAGWIGMIGGVMTLHFGVFHLLSCFWRSRGIEARALMHAPLRAASLADFWGRRWNTAFRDLTHRFLFTPLASRVGTRTAVAGGFAFSGLVHDLVISVPARGGYGGPTFFFALQGAALLAERSPIGRRWGLGRGAIGRAFTVAVIVLPVYWLFHPPFVERIVLPFMAALGAL
jgi:hypothetical protein